MAKLVISLNNVNVREFPLQSERITIGRNPDNDIALDDGVVSGQHAAIQLKPKPTITDLNSTNGTLLNGSPITKAELRHNDILRIGNHELRFIDTEVQNFAATMVLEEAPEAAKEQNAGAALKILSGPRSGELLKIKKQRTTLGKPGEQVIVILHQPHGYEMLLVAHGDTGLQAAINGRPLGNEPLLLKDGDEIHIADARLAFVENP